jgi:hypothetical protein
MSYPIGRGRVPLIVVLALYAVFCSCKRTGSSVDRSAPVAPSPITSEPAPPKPEPIAPEPPPALPAVKPKAQAESTRIAYNGVETFMRGTIGAGERKMFLLRVRKDQQVHINLDPPDTGISLAVSDEQGASIGTVATAWQWTTTYAGDLHIAVFSGTDKAQSGQKVEFTLRVAPY